MRIAITQYNHKPAFLKEKAKQLEIQFLIEDLEKTLSKSRGEEVKAYVVSYPVGKEKDLDYFLDYRDHNLQDFDLVILYNTGYNEKSVYEYNIVQNIQLTKCKNVMYFNSDPKYPLLNFPKFIDYRIRVKRNRMEFTKDPRSNNDLNLDIIEENGKKYLNSSPYTQENIEDYQNINWIIYFCGYDYLKYQSKIKKLDKFRIFVHNEKKIKNKIEYFPKFVNWKGLEINTNDNKSIDLFYFGDYRVERLKKYEKYLMNNISKKIMGFAKSRQNNISNAIFLPYAQMQNVINESNDCIATIIMGDNTHDNNIITPRFYESLYLDCVKFIDLEFDPNMTLFDSLDDKEFYYVGNLNDLRNKIETLKENGPEFIRKKIVDQQKLINNF
jgi:hypothetical protein